MCTYCTYLNSEHFVLTVTGKQKETGQKSTTHNTRHRFYMYGKRAYRYFTECESPKVLISYIEILSIFFVPLCLCYFKIIIKVVK